MKKLVFNPYLPSWEYIPDAEPRVFGNRVYIYGSHDRFNGKIFCLNDYVCWSAPVDDLSDWRYEGVIYRKKQDPSNRLGLRLLFAPDVVQGPDGRYYLYYCFDFKGEMGVAVSENRQGLLNFTEKYILRMDISGVEDPENLFHSIPVFWWMENRCGFIPVLRRRSPG